VAVQSVGRPAQYEARLQRYLFERSEEARAVRVGEKEVSEQAEIVARYPDLFSRDQLAALGGHEALASDVSGEADPVRRNEEEKGISLIELEGVLGAASEAATAAYERLGDKWFGPLPGGDGSVERAHRPPPGV
jgi:hypothetical protein